MNLTGRRDNEDLYTPEHQLHRSRLEALRQGLPHIARDVTQLVVDNPAQFALIGAGTIVLTRAAFRLVKPRNAVEALAVMVVLQLGLPKLALTAMEKEWLRFRIRDADGQLVPFDPRGVPGVVPQDT
jgi:hypothetical protein